MSGQILVLAAGSGGGSEERRDTRLYGDERRLIERWNILFSTAWSNSPASKPWISRAISPIRYCDQKIIRIDEL